MNIAVCVKQVPDTETKIKISEDKKHINESDVNFILNPYDEFAVEEGIKIKERFQISFWDALIIAAAQTVDASIIYSEDLNHGQKYGNVTVLNPFK